jgi:hypothetical protein
MPDSPDSKESKDPGFRVVDKRGRGPEDEAEKAEPVKPTEPPAAPAAPDPALGPIDLLTFIRSLGSSAAIHMGDAPDPEHGEHHKNVPQAKQIIDLLGMLREKTKGNLTPEEARFLDGLLYDLRLRFVEASK